MRHVLCFISLSLLAACATHPPSNPSAVPSDRIYLHAEQTESHSVPVRVTRDSGGMDDRFCEVKFLIDGDKTAILKTGETARFWVTPGKHIYGASQVTWACGFGETETAAEGATNLRLYFPFKGGLRISETAH